jgi:hypothetical protein
VVGVNSTCAGQQAVSLNFSCMSEFVRRDRDGGKRNHNQFSLEEKCKILEEIREQRCQAEREQMMETAHQFFLYH